MYKAGTDDNVHTIPHPLAWYTMCYSDKHV